jgi:hypothetical protein
VEANRDNSPNSYMAFFVKKKDSPYHEKTRFFDKGKTLTTAPGVFHLTDPAPRTTSCSDFNSKTGLPRLSCLHQTAIEGQPGRSR